MVHRVVPDPATSVRSGACAPHLGQQREHSRWPQEEHRHHHLNVEIENPVVLIDVSLGQSGRSRSGGPFRCTSVTHEPTLRVVRTSARSGSRGCPARGLDRDTPGKAEARDLSGVDRVQEALV